MTVRAALSRPPLRTVVIADGASLTGVSDLAHELGLEEALSPDQFEEGLVALLHEQA